MAETVEFDSSVKGGLPVCVVARIHPPEPDVGIFNHTAEIVSVHWTSGKEISDGVYASISTDDWLRLEDEALEADTF